MILRKIGRLGKAPKVFTFTRLPNFKMSQEIFSARNKLSKLQKTSQMHQVAQSFGNKVDENTHDKVIKNKEDINQEFNVDKTSELINENEETSQSIPNYVDNEKALENDMHMINYKSKLLVLLILHRSNL